MSAAHGQQANNQEVTLKIGDAVPSLKIKDWLKGDPVKNFEKGKIYVLEFWATWCKPCKAAMPRLSALNKKYRRKVTVIGVDVAERKNTTTEKVSEFVHDMGKRINYRIGTDDNNYMFAHWAEASGEQGIPNTFVVNAEGKLAWVGHPKDLHVVLDDIISNKWDLQKEINTRTVNSRLRQLDASSNFELSKYSDDLPKGDNYGKPDSALLAVEALLQKEPELKYAPFVSNHTFTALLKTNPDEAYNYGKRLLTETTYGETSYDNIIMAVTEYYNKFTLTPKLYHLAAEAYQVQIDQIPYPEIAELGALYTRMSEWYSRSGDLKLAILAHRSAAKALKGQIRTRRRWK